MRCPGGLVAQAQPDEPGIARGNDAALVTPSPSIARVLEHDTGQLWEQAQPLGARPPRGKLLGAPRHGGGVRLFATCPRGLEDVGAQEVRALTGACATPDRDKVLFAARWEEVCALHVRARTLHKVHLLLHRGEARGLDDAARAAREVDWEPWLRGRSFAVRPVRAGTHAFGSLDVGRVVGAAIAQGTGASVDLDRPDVEVSALLRGEELLLGVNLTGESLHKRAWRVAPHPAPLRTTLAAALLRWAGYEPGQGLWDPMCGGGTWPIEAALLARRVPPNALRGFAMERLPGFPAQALQEQRRAALAQATRERFPILGSELHASRLERAVENARAAGALDTLTLRALDATRCAELPFQPGLVVCNPPFGVRLREAELDKLYARFAARMAELGPRALVVLAAGKRFAQAAERAGLRPVEQRDVLHGALHAKALRFAPGAARDAPAGDARPREAA